MIRTFASTTLRRACTPARVTGLLLGALAVLAGPTGVAAQYGFLGSLGNRFSDLSFFANIGGLAPSTDEVRSDGLRSFGMEILFTVGTVTRRTGPVPETRDSVRLVWREMRVERTAEGVDTVDIYDVERVSARAPTRDVWTFELGLGYGQVSGFQARAPGLDLKGSVRDLPSVSLYASYEGLGTYFGLRSGLMELSGLQLIDDEGAAWKGSGKSFLAGLVAGQAWSVADLNFFVEASYVVRDFPSVEWSGSPPPETPRSMDLSGWSVGTGIQFAIGG